MRKGRALVICAILLAGCGGDENNVGGGGDDAAGGPREIPDGFVIQGCQQNNDCDDGDLCTIDTCNASSKTCDHATVKCDDPSMNDDCQKGVCDKTLGSCTAMPINEMGACLDPTSMQPGACTAGSCLPIPQCSLSFYDLDCSSYNKTTTGSTSGTGMLDTYKCAGATGLTGPEEAYPFKVTTERDVTLSLTGTSSDLDLMVLAGKFCTGVADCVASANTVGVGDEMLTFHATANTDYTIVIDGRNGALGSYTLNISCMGGTCKPIKTLACNQSVMGDTTGPNATNYIPSYACAATEMGPEDTYQITQSSDTNYKMSVTGLTQDLDLVVVYESGGECDPTFCKASSTNTGTMDETASWTGYGGSTYDVIVDSKMTGGPYMLQVDCPPSCSTSYYMDCYTQSDSRKNDDATRSKKIVDNWACDPGTTGPEVVYKFEPSTSGQYTFTLDGLTADLDLIVVAGDYSTCDPTTACVASSVTGGNASESVTFMADSSKVYYVAVDGKNGAVSSYNLKLKSTLCPGASCYNSANSLGCTYLEDARSNNDTARSKNLVDAWPCDMNTNGPEVVYKFTPPANGNYTVSLDNLSADLDLIVTTGTSYSCDANTACVASSVNMGTMGESVTFAAVTTNTYYIAVDGKNGAVGTYHVKLSSTSCPAPVCKAASTSLSCAYPSTSARNDATGSTNDVGSWACDANTTGPENAHSFKPPVAGMYTAELIGLHADLDLVVVAGTGSSSSTCTPTAACVGSSTNSGNTSEKVVFQGDPTKTYYLVVDGKNGATSGYTIAITDGCP
jgi:hypothetical protein